MDPALAVVFDLEVPLFFLAGDFLPPPAVSDPLLADLAAFAFPSLLDLLLLDLLLLDLPVVDLPVVDLPVLDLPVLDLPVLDLLLLLDFLVDDSVDLAEDVFLAAGVAVSVVESLPTAFAGEDFVDADFFFAVFLAAAFLARAAFSAV